MYLLPRRPWRGISVAGRENDPGPPGAAIGVSDTPGPVENDVSGAAAGAPAPDPAVVIAAANALAADTSPAVRISNDTITLFITHSPMADGATSLRRRTKGTQRIRQPEALLPRFGRPLHHPRPGATDAVVQPGSGAIEPRAFLILFRRRQRRMTHGALGFRSRRFGGRCRRLGGRRRRLDLVELRPDLVLTGLALPVGGPAIRIPGDRGRWKSFRGSQVRQDRPPQRILVHGGSGRVLSNAAVRPEFWKAGCKRGQLAVQLVRRIGARRRRSPFGDGILDSRFWEGIFPDDERSGSGHDSRHHRRRKRKSPRRNDAPRRP